MKRLDRARLHYENLLMHAGNALLMDEETSSSINQTPNSPITHSFGQAIPTRQVDSSFSQSLLSTSFHPVSLMKSPVKISSAGAFMHEGNSMMSEREISTTFKSPIKSVAGGVDNTELLGPVIGNNEKNDIILSLQVPPSRHQYKINGFDYRYDICRRKMTAYVGS